MQPEFVSMLSLNLTLSKHETASLSTHLSYHLHDLQILTIESVKAINRLYALLSSSNGKHTMILNWSKVSTSHDVYVVLFLKCS
jgi:hypothetical protein